MTEWERKRAEWQAQAREFARQFCIEHGSITIDDVREFGPPLPEGINPYAYAGVLPAKSPEWVKMGYEAGRREISGKRPVMRWRLAVMPSRPSKPSGFASSA